MALGQTLCPAGHRVECSAKARTESGTLRSCSGWTERFLFCAHLLRDSCLLVFRSFWLLNKFSASCGSSRASHPRAPAGRHGQVLPGPPSSTLSSGGGGLLPFHFLPQAGACPTPPLGQGHFPTLPNQMEPLTFPGESRLCSKPKAGCSQTWFWSDSQRLPSPPVHFRSVGPHTKLVFSW